MLVARLRKEGVISTEWFDTVKEFNRATWSPAVEVLAVEKVASNAELERFGFCVNHGGKMRGVLSISISPFNRFCNKRASDPGSVCPHCYARQYAQARPGLNAKLQRNTEKLTREIIPIEELPVIDPVKWPLLRFESFGDIISTEQVINYYNIARRNPSIKCALWTKNYRFIESAGAAGEAIPDNLVVIVSSPSLNKERSINHYRFADKVFTVYSKDFVRGSLGGVDINCGARSCYSCRKCYSKEGDCFIRELLK